MYKEANSSVRMRCASAALICLVFFRAVNASAQVTSALWGVSGEAWDPTNSILRDFTHVGYKGGDVPIPGTNDWPNAVSVLDFGAIPDDFQDDSEAFIAAISNCPDYSAVFVPRGRYLITKKISPQRNHFVLRGEDMYETILFYPKYLSEVYIEEVGWQGGGSTPKNTADGSFIQFNTGEEQSIENLTLEFREQRKISPWEYIGANFMSIGGSNCWVRNIYMKNYDSGIGINGKYHSLINIIADQFNGRQAVDNDQSGKLDAYSAIMPRNMSRVLLHNIDITGHLLQPIDNNEASTWSVFSKCRTGEGNNRVVGLHGGSAKYHLYTELNRGVSRENNELGSSLNWSNCTYWGIDGELSGGVYSNTVNGSIYVGWGDDYPLKTTDTCWYEPAAYGQLTPGNLYLAQLEKLGKPLPEDFVNPPLEAYERGGDVFRVVPTDDVTPNYAYDSMLTIKNGAYFKFDLSQATETNIACARLQFAFKAIVNTPFRVAVYSVTNDTWVETNLTAANKPAVGTELDSEWIYDGRSNLVVELDVTAFVASELVGGDGVISLYADFPEGNGLNSVAWGAEEGKKPELIIERVADPVPGPPSAPKGIRSTALVGNIALDWDDVPESDFASYNVYRSSPADGWLPQSGGLVTSDHVDVSSEDDWHCGMMDYRKVYHYWITAVDEHGYESEKSKEFVAAVYHPSNAPPAFVSTVSLDPAAARNAYIETLAPEASDPESDQMYFMKVSGPDWLDVALDGTLSGTPGLSDTGSNQFTFQVTAIGGSTQKVVNITVDLPADDPPGAPAAPTNLVAAVDYNTVRLEWDDNVEADLAGYYVYRSLTSGNYGDAFATNSPLSSGYVDSDAVNGTTYYYVVAAFDYNDNESAQSLEISAVPVDAAPAAPTGLAANAGDASVALKWNANDESDLESYSVYRSTTSSNYPATALATVSTNTYVDETAANGITYYYAVTAVDDGSNESGKSSEVSATPAPWNPVVVAYYPFNGFSKVSSDAETNSFAGDMVVGAGVTTFKWETRIFWSPTQPSAAFDAGTDFADGTVLDDDYFSFTITPEEGITLDLASLSFIDRSGGFSVSVASDQDSFATVVDSTVAAGNWATNSLDLSFLSSTTNATEIRLYFHNGSGDNRMIDNVTISANVISGTPLTGYDLWAAGWGTNDIGGMTNDFELDGLINWIEYALGGNPVSNDASDVLPAWSIASDGGSNWFYYAYNRRDDAAARGLTYTVMTGTNLVDGLSNAVPAWSVTPATNGFETATHRIPTDEATSGYMQLEIEFAE